MPVVSRSNNRIIPANQRTPDVARTTLQALLPVQRARYHNAFRVQGFSGILFNCLTSGLKCYCQNRDHAAASRLNKDGSATPGLLNTLLTGADFGVLPYGVGINDNMGPNPELYNKPPREDPDPTPTAPGTYTIEQPPFAPDEHALPGLYDSDWAQDPKGLTGSWQDTYTRKPGMPNNTVIDSGVGPNGPVDDFEFEDLLTEGDFGPTGSADFACPVCMGTGFVGGYSVLNGWRKVFNFQHPGADFGAADIDFVSSDLPTINNAREATFEFVAPAHVLSVDAFRVWNKFKVIPAKAFIDEVRITSVSSLIPFFTGVKRTLRIEFDKPTQFTHVELQVNQSDEDAYFDLPKQIKSSSRLMLEGTQPFTVLFSPIIPRVGTGDVLSDSTYGNVLHISNVSPWNDKSRTVLGWSAEVRPVQPQEILNLLPRRQINPRTTPLVRDNMRGHRRT